MSKSLGDVLRWFRAVDGTTLGCVALSLPQVTALAAVLDAADAMRAAADFARSEATIVRDAEQYPESGTPFNVARDCAANILKRMANASAAYDAARAALAEALKEGR